MSCDVVGVWFKPNISVRTTLSTLIIECQSISFQILTHIFNWNSSFFANLNALNLLEHSRVSIFYWIITSRLLCVSIFSFTIPSIYCIFFKLTIDFNPCWSNQAGIFIVAFSCLRFMLYQAAVSWKWGKGHCQTDYLLN